jgi:hypothetical protein
MSRHVVTTFDEAVRLLGGVAAVARLTKRSMTAVCNWRRETQRFPTKLFLRMEPHFIARGVVADPALWGLEPADDAPSIVPGANVTIAA